MASCRPRFGCRWCSVISNKADLDRNLRMANQERLRQLKSTHGHEVTIFNSHDPVDYENCRCGQH
jgi:hypothetical protein